MEPETPKEVKMISEFIQKILPKFGGEMSLAVAQLNSTLNQIYENLLKEKGVSHEEINERVQIGLEKMSEIIVNIKIPGNAGIISPIQREDI